MIIDYNKALDDGRFLFLRSPYHKDYGPDEIQAYLIAPCKSNAIRLYYRNNRPIGMITWAWFEEQKAKDFLHFEYLPTEEDYIKKPDTQLWGIEMIAPYGDGKTILKSIQEEYRNVYGEEETIRWRRAKNPLRVIKRKLT